jgi:hypothetical protein
MQDGSGKKLSRIKKKEKLKIIVILQHTNLPDVYTYLHVPTIFHPFQEGLFQNAVPFLGNSTSIIFVMDRNAELSGKI